MIKCGGMLCSAIARSTGDWPEPYGPQRTPKVKVHTEFVGCQGLLVVYQMLATIDTAIPYDVHR